MLSVQEIKKFMDEDALSEKKRAAAVGVRYYEADHDINRSRMFYYNADGVLVEDKARSNIKISHPYFTELTDQLAAHVLSFDENPIRAIETADGLQEHLDKYFDDDFWSEAEELISGCYVKGFEYLYAFKNEAGKLVFQCADSMGVVEVREKDSDDGCAYVIYWYVDRIEKGKKKIKRIQVWSETETHYFVQIGEGKIIKDESHELNPRPHVVFTDERGQKMGYGLGYIPFWRLDYNKKQHSGLKPIKPLIDDHDLMMCGLSNNLTDFDTPLHVVTGFDGDNLEELQQNLKTKKIIGVDSDGGVSVQTIEIPYEARKVKAEADERAIYHFGMGLNTAGLKDSNATTNLAIKALYTLLDLKSDKVERRFKKLLRQILKPVLADINDENGTDYQITDIYFDFVRKPITNESETIQNDKTRAETKQIEVNTVLNVAAVIGDEAALKIICEQLDLDFDELKGQLEEMKAEQDAAAARAALDAVQVEPLPAEIV